MNHRCMLAIVLTKSCLTIFITRHSNYSAVHFKAKLSSNFTVVHSVLFSSDHFEITQGVKVSSTVLDPVFLFSL